MDLLREVEERKTTAQKLSSNKLDINSDHSVDGGLSDITEEGQSHNSVKQVELGEPPPETGFQCLVRK